MTIYEESRSLDFGTEKKEPTKDFDKVVEEYNDHMNDLINLQSFFTLSSCQDTRHRHRSVAGNAKNERIFVQRFRARS